MQKGQLILLARADLKPMIDLISNWIVPAGDDSEGGHVRTTLGLTVAQEFHNIAQGFHDGNTTQIKGAIDKLQQYVVEIYGNDK